MKIVLGVLLVSVLWRVMGRSADVCAAGGAIAIIVRNANRDFQTCSGP